MGLRVPAPSHCALVFLVSSPQPEAPWGTQPPVISLPYKKTLLSLRKLQGFSLPMPGTRRWRPNICFLLYHSVTRNLISVEAGEGTRVQRHTEGSRAEPGLDPRATPGFPWALSEVCPGICGSHFSPWPGRWKAWPKGTPRFVPVPSLSCLVPCPADGQVSPAELAPARVPHAPASHGLLSQVGWVVCGRKQVSAGLRSFDLESADFTLCQVRALRPQTKAITPPSLTGHTLQNGGCVFGGEGNCPFFLLVLTGLIIRST